MADDRLKQIDQVSRLGGREARRGLVKNDQVSSWLSTSAISSRRCSP